MATTMLDAMDEEFTGDVEYLDLDGDGVPDAVRTTAVTVVHGATEDMVQVREELDAGIDIDGVPRSVELHETVVDAAH